jgi:uncharacterized 2Fe-2S/4Fe-4S cluster protein (DUF4445 family)
MKTADVLFLPHNVRTTVKQGENLIRAALGAGVHINASCGGDGVCGKCRVIIEKGKIDGGLTEKLTKEDIEKGYRQACLTSVQGDIVVRIPIESDVDARWLNLQKPPRRTAKIWEMNLQGLKEKGLFLAPVEKRYLELPKPSSQDHLPDVTRLVSFLKAQYDEHRLVVQLPVIRKIPDVLRKDDFKVTATLLRPVHSGRKTQIINIQPGDTTDRNYAIAVDIGTTTVYSQLLDLITGEVLASYGEYNGQISYGEDVISRIMYAGKSDGLETLHGVVITTINTLIKKMLKRARIDKEEISTITMAGNTTMTQLMLKVNPKYIRLSPYVPAATLFAPVRAVDLGLALDDHVTALVFPAISSYVGGDIVAGVMGSGMYRTDQVSLFMDIGTNAEIVIGNKDWLACAACSAGPAFEGGGLTFGMRAAKGAIEDFSMDPVTFEPMNITVGDVRPKGICGSGLIAMVAVMFEMGVIDNRGKFNRDLDTPRIRNNNGIIEYVLAWKEETQIDRDISLSEPDLDNLIRAKGAIFSGCMTLLEEVGLGIHDIERVYLSGGFGSYVDLEKAMIIGLLPEIDPEKVKFIGNGSLMGAKMSSLTNRIRKDVVDVTKRMTNFELSETHSYMDNYVAALFFPHTNMSLFPKLKARLEARKATSLAQ